MKYIHILKNSKRVLFTAVVAFAILLGTTGNIYAEAGFVTESGAQQKTTVTGTVKAADGTLLPGLSIIVKGTTVGTTTNPDGKYTLRY